MQYLISALLISISAPLILRIIIFKAESTKYSSTNIFKYPTFLTKFYLVGILFVSAIFIWAFLDIDYQTRALLYIIMLCLFYFPLVTVTILLILRTLNFSLILDEEYMIYRNLFGKVKRIRYEEITKVKIRMDRYNIPTR